MFSLMISMCFPGDKDRDDADPKKYKLSSAKENAEMEKLEARVSRLNVQSPVISHLCQRGGCCASRESEEKGTLSEEMRWLHGILEAVHERVSRNEIELKESPTDTTMLAALAKFTTVEIATRVLSSLKLLWKGAKIIRFRSSVVYALISQEIYCPVVEWIEDDDTQAVAFFNIGSPNAYSWLAHYGKLSRENGQLKWSKSCTKFCAETMGYLKVLVEAAQHLSGILAWDTKDIVRLYCRIRPQEPETNEEIQRQLQLIISHVEKIRDVSHRFDHMSPALEPYCEKTSFGPVTLE